MGKLKAVISQEKGSDIYMNKPFENPVWAEREAKRRGGVLRYRMMRRGGKLFRVMVTRKAGKRGGRTIAYEV
jgi:hypothetical protein